jgi:hypothetical protein
MEMYVPIDLGIWTNLDLVVDRHFFGGRGGDNTSSLLKRKERPIRNISQLSSKTAPKRAEVSITGYQSYTGILPPRFRKNSSIIRAGSPEA